MATTINENIMPMLAHSAYRQLAVPKYLKYGRDLKGHRVSVSS